MKKILYNGLLIPVLYGICMTIVADKHYGFVEFDGAMHYFAGEDIFRGNGYRGWGSHFWPPLFPLLSGILGRWLDGATAARMISVLSASFLLWIAHRFVYKLSQNHVVACLAQLLIATNFMFVLLSIKAENHMLDTLFYVLAIFLLLQSLEKDSTARFFITGLVCGLAGLSRYTSYSLVPAFACTVFCFYPSRLAFRYALVILAGFILVSSPWWAVNYLDNGSPLSTWQYMNVGAGVYSGAGSRWWWYWSGIDHVQSIGDIIAQRPGDYLLNFSRNVVKSILYIVAKSQLTGIICIASLFLLMYRGYRSRGVLLWRDRLFLPVLVALAVYILLVSQAFVFGEVFLSWIVLVMIYGVYAIYRLRPATGFFRKNYRPVMLSVIVLVVVVDVCYTNWSLNNYMTDAAGIEENGQIAAAIKAQEGNLEHKVVMTLHPARAYYLRSRYVMLPPYYEGDLNGLITYQGMSFKVRDHAPRFPSTLNVNDLKVDYLIYDRWAATCLPQFSFLLHKNSNRIPASFQLVYLSQAVAVYKINGQYVHQQH
ncbi:glycosyltransferase family 39 protein [uncultured Chitinophaga sp.]|uniref:ArnT family glycosyltransferase n=1 Tax=uncultured Chitinophaga sp. TaxID=339340 RepID=UPI002627B20B|nr:glycosyltransferase family 39 protein [uncultured Chitinophaga sp.]